MVHLQRLCLVLIVMMACVATPFADDIFQTNAEGQRRLIQRNAIVVAEDSSVVIYKHFDLKEERVVKVVLQQGSLPYDVERSPAGTRQQIVDLWKRFGHAATVTNQAGKPTHLYDTFLDFYPPGGRGSLFESVAARTSFPVLLDSGGADSIEFSDTAQVTIRSDRLELSLRNGKTESAKFLMPTSKPAEARFLGITDHYDPVSPDVFDFGISLSQVKEILFEE